MMVPSLKNIQVLDCESCQLGKHVRSSYPKRSETQCDFPFSIIHSDIWGPSRVTSFGFNYFVTFIDEFSRCTWVYLMKERSELLSIFKSFFIEIKNQFGKTIKILRSDNAKEYFSLAFSSFLSSQGILHQSTCPHTPQQNGIAERKNRHLIETARSLMLNTNVPVHHWGDAVLTACFLINRMPSSSLNNKIPHSVIFPNDTLYHVSLRVFGCMCFVHNVSPGLDKLSAKAIKCVFLGYSRLQKGYRCYSPSTKRYYMSADVTFFEDTPFFSSSMEDRSSVQQMFPLPTCDPLIIPDSVPQNQNPNNIVPPPLITYQRRTQSRTPNTDDPRDSDPSASDPQTMDPSSSSPSTDSDDNWPIALRKGIRSTRNPYPIYNFVSYHNLSPTYFSFVSSLSSTKVPNNIHEALVHSGWRQAMVDEMKALEHNGTWDLVPLPPDKKPVGCRWIYTVKVGPTGKIDRLKARLVAKGYTQVYGQDYCDTFSPVAKTSTVRIFLAMPAIRYWPLYQLDIKNAFLHGDLEEEIYMEQPPGFVAQGESGLVCKLRRSLYGLKQSPRAWFGKFSQVVQKFGLKRCEADHSVFYGHYSPDKCVYLMVYVDDIVITGNDITRINQLKNHLFNHFQTKDLGRLKYFLGIEVAQSKEGVIISQRKYALDILEETGLTNCKPIDNPMDPNQKLMTDQGEPFSDPERYRRLVGKLIYLTITRPDLSYPVGVVSQFMQNPHVDHWNAVLRILRYIKGSPGQGLLYENKGNTRIKGYCDADWAGSPIDRRSTTGYCVLLGGNLVSWKSKKQNVVARSSAEAEYRSMALTTCELVWIKQLLQELKFCENEQMKLYCDNQAALHISSNPVFHERTKHIEIDCHFIREKLLSKELVTEFVNSNEQLGDMLTKSLRGPRIQFICSKLGAYDLYAPA
ncbi:Retrovirus-related Pol polyprotein from transposon RE1 Retro element 1 [Vigna angularis]|uniref:Retrovirus-related Pol polyprotein from transposon RE1 Retro element 1 n=2 Tax=Phaseolus angularis TaxID=3914 RepID=A0A8T0L2K0_PHAAN|nr:Retrovirus-related Pol polyprotein from transposon RE1 Retro element 1 [Vigna angularis]